MSFHRNLIIIPHRIMINKVRRNRLSFPILFLSFALDPNSGKTDSNNLNDMIDIDERLKSLEKFMKENLPS